MLVVGAGEQAVGLARGLQVDRTVLAERVTATAKYLMSLRPGFTAGEPGGADGHAVLDGASPSGCTDGTGPLVRPDGPCLADPGCVVTLTLCGQWLTPDTGRGLLVVGPSLGTGVRKLWYGAVALTAITAGVDVLGEDVPRHGDGPPLGVPFTLSDLADAVTDLIERPRPGAANHHAGVSVAGAVGLELALKVDRGRDTGLGEPRLRGSAVICSGSRLGTPQGWVERAHLVRRAGTPVMVEGSARRWFAPGFAERQPDVVGGLLTSLQHTDKVSYPRGCEAPARFDVTDRLVDISVPVLVLGGRHDEVAPPADQQALEVAVQGASLVLLDDAAHLAPAEQPEQVARALVTWIADSTATQEAP